MVEKCLASLDEAKGRNGLIRGRYLLRGDENIDIGISPVVSNVIEEAGKYRPRGGYIGL